MGSELGVPDEKILALEGYAESPLYDEMERAALEYADAITLTDREVGEELFERVRAFFDDDALVELTAAIAWENSSSKFNRALRVPSQHLWQGSRDSRATGAARPGEDDVRASTQRSKAQRLRQLHREGDMLVLPNAWDGMSARVFEDCGFPAIATTSAGIAYALGYPDGERLGRDEMAQATAHIAGAVSVPVTADVEAGYGNTPEEVAETAQAVIEAGAVGLNFEDVAEPEPPGHSAFPGKGNASPLVDLEEQLERIRAIVEVGQAASVPLVVNARTDVYWREVGSAEGRFGETVRRAKAFLQAGADCVFVPGVRDAETISALAREIPGPLNVLAGPGLPTTTELTVLGVRRVSVGSGPARAIMGLARRIGRELLEEGIYDSLVEGAIPYAEANRLFARPDGSR